MSVRVYTLLTDDQKSRLSELAGLVDRSMSYLIARAIDEHVASATPSNKTKDDAPNKLFTRTTVSAAVNVKERATLTECHDWQIVNACVERYLQDALDHV
jgi:hypothetical protein